MLVVGMVDILCVCVFLEGVYGYYILVVVYLFVDVLYWIGEGVRDLGPFRSPFQQGRGGLFLLRSISLCGVISILSVLIGVCVDIVWV